MKVDPAALHLGSNDMFNAIGEAALDFFNHEDGLAAAAPGWIGSSELALGELAVRWQTRHDHHQLQVDRLASHVADAMLGYLINEDESARAFRSVRK
ncbi:RNA 2'-phosphotransferase [Mycobacterium marseillense]|uniref:RNA 2'-phosphotransferase n=1 Tax=Mycobacterium marseillense TaxID=701042 RepID=A0AAC9VXJ3_9MYCO|nr:RNA 2'-phosphotransferase [Mycobacterium marseillense]